MGRVTWRSGSRLTVSVAPPRLFSDLVGSDFLSFAAGISLENLVCRCLKAMSSCERFLRIGKPKLPGKSRRRCSGWLVARWYCCSCPIRAGRALKGLLCIGDR
jgi:hypothetical protein